MITPSFSLTATERVLPKLALDFTTANLDSRVTFTRTTDATHPATYINSSGIVTAATNNQPRFDYNPVTLACKGLLIEESRTNLLTYSEQFNDAVWLKYQSYITADAAVSPDGTLTADKLFERSSGAASHQTYRDIVLTATPYTISVYAKAAERNYLVLRLDTGSGKYAYFNLATGTVGNVDAQYTATSITSMGNGWYKCTATVTATAATWTAAIQLSADGTTPIYPGDGTSGIYIWGAQLEAGAFATSYIPTTSAALTRNADVATMTGTNFSDWWTATTGGASVYATPQTITGTNPLFQVDDNTAANQICLRGNAANPELYIKATTDQAQIDAGTIIANTAYKLAGAWNTNNCAAAQNGAAVVTDTSATIPTVTQARIGCDGTNYANAWIATINYWPQRITDNETQAFSK